MQTWVRQLIKEYADNKKKLERYGVTLNRDLTSLKRDDPAVLPLQLEISTVDGMIREMAFAIQWMETGRQPGLYRGVDRRGAYERPYVLDKDLFPSLQEPEPVRTLRLTDDQRRMAIEAIRSLSDRERDCYLLHMAQGMSMGKIAKELKITKPTVQDYINRAKKKILESQAGQEV